MECLKVLEVQGNVGLQHEFMPQREHVFDCVDCEILFSGLKDPEAQDSNHLPSNALVGRLGLTLVSLFQGPREAILYDQGLRGDLRIRQGKLHPLALRDLLCHPPDHLLSLPLHRNPNQLL